MYNLADIKRKFRKLRFIKEQRRLLETNFIQKICIFLMRKILYFISISVKCIFWQIYL